MQTKEERALKLAGMTRDELLESLDLIEIEGCFSCEKIMREVFFESFLATQKSITRDIRRIYAPSWKLGIRDVHRTGLRGEDSWDLQDLSRFIDNCMIGDMMGTSKLRNLVEENFDEI